MRFLHWVRTSSSLVYKPTDLLKGQFIKGLFPINSPLE